MFENISVKDALKLAYGGKAILLDVRTKEAYQRGHLPMARHVTESGLEELLNKEPYKKIVLYCDFGNYSMHLAKTYGEMGYNNLASMVGGYHAYEGYVELKKGSLWTMEWKLKNEV